MDQPTDDWRRDLSGREIQPARGAPQRDRSWIDRLRDRRRLVLALTALVIVTIVGFVVWWVHTGGHVSTDDAFIDVRSVSVSSQVSAAVVDVPVTDNELVAAGTVLVRLDDRDFKAQVDQATAQVAQAQANLSVAGAQIDTQQARIEQADKQIAQAQAALTFAQQQNSRYQKLATTGGGTVEQAEQYKSGLLQAQASLASAQANAVATQKQLAVLRAQRTQADAQLQQARAFLEQADVNLSRTVITAPVDGRVADLTAAKGEYAAVDQVLMIFVPRHVWVTANFKETELSGIRPGDPVAIEIDAYPGRSFKGHIDSIQPGSGTAFSLLPSENATGNYVKIVQRVPVKIVFDQPPDVLLGPGMSVVPTVKIR
jgi:membrane fusion protein, multidrug efflux system